MSPSSVSTFAPVSRSRRSMMPATVLLPEPERPVNQSVNPLCIRAQDLRNHHVQFGYRFAVGRKMDAALFGCVLLPPPAARAFVLSRRNRPCARRASDALVSLGVERMHGNIVNANVFAN